MPSMPVQTARGVLVPGYRLLRRINAVPALSAEACSRRRLANEF